MSGEAILENVRRYRTIASLYRQTAAFRPAQKWTLLEQAYEWERLAMTELEAHFTVRDGRISDCRQRAVYHLDLGQELAVAA
jgi:hypothetical protein